MLVALSMLLLLSVAVGCLVGKAIHYKDRDDETLSPQGRDSLG